jgi:uncharacterized protein (DUF433 family)
LKITLAIAGTKTVKWKAFSPKFKGEFSIDNQATEVTHRLKPIVIVIRVSNTRVAISPVVAVFNQRTTAEEIVYRYPLLKLADVYATIAFYLKHQPKVKTYLEQRQQQAKEVRKMNKAKFEPQGLRARLLARKA